MSISNSRVSRRAFLSANATVLASVGLTAVPDAVAQAEPQASSPLDLARFRPVQASSTAYAATPPHFAVDGLYQSGVQGSGWRAGTREDPQWIEVDLQAECLVEALTLTFEAKPGDPEWVSGGASEVNRWAGTTGYEVLSSYPVAYEITVSLDGRTWASAHRNERGTGAVTTITLDAPVAARWVRLTATIRSTGNPLGLNGFQVFGTCATGRPAASGWTDWGVHRQGPPPLETAHDGTVPLESGWTLTYDAKVPAATGASLARVGIDTSAWLSATVPGTVLAALVEQGHLPDPVSGLNNLLIPEALSRHSWWYRRQFRVPEALHTGSGRRIWLEFDGINHHAEIWLDGVHLGEMTHPFQRARFDVTAHLGSAQGEHAIAVRIDPMPVPGNPGDRGPDGYSYTDAGSDMMNRNSPTYLAVSGWDWMPAVRDRVSGIWNHVRLRSTGPILVGDPGIRSELPDRDTAKLTITVPVHNPSAAERPVRVKASFGSVRLAQSMTVPPGGQVDAVFDEVTVTKPKLWWPNGYGEPHRYDLRVSAEVEGVVSDDRTVKFGIRKVRYETVPGLSVPPGGSAAKSTTFDRCVARYVRIQCDRRATAWGSSMFALSVTDSANPAVDLALHRPATASSQDNADNGPDKAVDGQANTRWSSSYRDDQWIQVDLGTAVAFDTVTIEWESAFASELRILVSADGADFAEAAAVSNGATPLRLVVNGVPVFIRGGAWGWDELLRRALPDRLSHAVRLHKDLGFTMIRAWLGSVTREELYDHCDANGIMVWNEFPSAWFLDPPDHAVYLAQAHDTVLRYRHHPCLVLWCAKNEGDPSPDIDAALRTSVTSLTDTLYVSNSIAGPFHADGGYSWRPPEDYFSGAASGGRFGLHSEIGLPTVPVEESMRNLLGIGEDSDEGWPISGAWYMHDWSAKGAQNPLSYKEAIDTRLGESADLGEFCRKAQLINYEAMRALFEAFNARLWHDANGVLLWMSHPAWHSTVWQVYDYDLDVNGTYYGARTANEMIHVQANQPRWDVVVVNHAARAVQRGTVTAELFGFDGRRLAQPQRSSMDVAAGAVTPAFSVNWPADAPAAHLLLLTFTDRAGRTLSRNTYWRYRTASDLRAINDVAPTHVRVRQRRRGDALVVRLTNTGATVAAMVRLSARDKRSGRRVLPVIYDDNYLWLLPGETREIGVRSLADHPARRLTVAVDGYNVPQT
ncbi:discoidin domain-containing protein [Actinoplanes sp. TFC3]|uniref:discoidin domain-containing protein n=1 Tax=Actinoplanes sp. TFC3 TaxID=1710355 RepID=UPI0008295D3C|nr:discoidin domain-containing protein [Actinoplanes sp. TFC3]